MRGSMMLVVAACGGGHGGLGENDEIVLVGECDPAPNTTDLTTAPVPIAQAAQDCLVQRARALDVVESSAQWDALFDCGEPPPAAPVDFASERVALVHVTCSPIDFRFGVESDVEVVVGVVSGISGACLANVLAVPLPASTKPVRLAQCQEQCRGECPPVP